MEITDQQLTTKLTGFIGGISKMTPKERQAQPTIQFAQDYNRARTFALQLHPDLGEVFPPEIEICREPMMNGAVGTYGEILTYCHHLLGFVSGSNLGVVF